MNVVLLRKLWSAGYCCHAAFCRLKMELGKDGPPSGRLITPAQVARLLNISHNAAKQLRIRFLRGEFACIAETEAGVKYENQRPPCMGVEIKNVGERQVSPFEKEFLDLLGTNCNLTKLLGNTSMGTLELKENSLGHICGKSRRPWLTVRVRMLEIDKCPLKLGDWVLLNAKYRGTVVDIDYDEFTVLFTSERHQSRVVV